MTFTLTIPDENLQELHMQSGIFNRTKLCQEMVSFYQWMLDEVWSGNEIVSQDPEGQHQKVINCTSIQNIQRRRQNFLHGKK
ncbi:hypothetical protein ACQKLP_12115 [Chitinophaga sp. NPDC101104]|uniref:hypothetical protein n=1 Tax=Chitinophaga sp. NPDC101104 TaxID=3390561 RepID=UPI003D026ED6